MHDCIVIGSGPAGVSAAYALMNKGRRVTMLDAGLRLEPERASTVDAVSRTPASGWSDGLVAPLKEGVEASAKGIPLKRLYGSDYPFRGTDRAYEIEKHGVDVAPSFALGGLSTVWGSGVLPFHDSDTSDWPIDSADLAEHYRAVFSFMPCSAARDDLERHFPLYADRVANLEPSRQAHQFFGDAGRKKLRLDRGGITVGRSRLAVDPDGDGRWRKPACERCGLCLYGCPHRLIYNAQFTVEELTRREGFTYRPDVVVERIEEKDGKVIVHGRDRIGDGKVREVGEKAFLGAGVLPTTAILLRSLERFDRPTEIQDSMYFLLPMVRFRGMKDLEAERLHTLAQAFIVVRDGAICPEFIHLSMYTYNDLMVSALKKSGGPFGRGFDRMWKGLGSRMLILGGYLHSRHSPRILMTLKKDVTDGRSSIRLDGVDNPASKPMVRKLGRKLLRHANDFKAMPLLPMVRFALPGRGFHLGGSFPMRAEPGEGSSDRLGRPHGFRSTYIVDASSFPSIPATTITLPIMANAHRIASEAVENGR